MRYQFTVQSAQVMHIQQDPFKTIHSCHGGSRVIGIPAFDDNVIWLLQGEVQEPGLPQSVCVVDPGDAAPVIDYCRRHQLVPTQILLTHHHGDHTGGVPALVSWMAQTHPAAAVTVYGPEAEGIGSVNYPLSGGERLTLWPDLVIDVMSVAGHTRGHLAYFVPRSAACAPPALFSGDLLFGLGCGRLFEGTAEQMFDALRRVSQLDPETRIYCAHEYTALNLPFALMVDPSNSQLEKRAAQILSLRHAGKSTLPLLLREELETNPFLRCAEAPLLLASGANASASPVQVFACLRTQRDSFKAA